VTAGGAIDWAANKNVAKAVADEAIVLLRNRAGALPLAAGTRRIAVIGGLADSGVLSGGGSSQVHAAGGPVGTVLSGATGVFGSMQAEEYQRTTPPLDAIRAKAPTAEVTYRNGAYISEAVAQARKADVAIVFANQWQTEGLDSADLSLPRGQDELIAAVADANPNTIVVLQTGSAVAMPWLDKTAAVLEAWYPGAAGGEAIASVLFGDTNPSGRLPITFPTGGAQLPRQTLDGSDTVEPNFLGKGKPGQTLEVDYNVEGPDVGYRWNARKDQKALFPFGFGLSYTSFTTSDLKVEKSRATFTVRNSGTRAGATVAQLYLVSTPEGPLQRLVAFGKVSLAPGESQRMVIPLENRIVANWRDDGWTIKAGSYGFALGENAEALSSVTTVRLKGRHWRD
jgi:beta-glucosidase